MTRFRLEYAPESSALAGVGDDVKECGYPSSPVRVRDAAGQLLLTDGGGHVLHFSRAAVAITWLSERHPGAIVEPAAPNVCRVCGKHECWEQEHRDSCDRQKVSRWVRANTEDER